MNLPHSTGTGAGGIGWAGELRRQGAERKDLYLDAPAEAVGTARDGWKETGFGCGVVGGLGLGVVGEAAPCVSARSPPQKNDTVTDIATDRLHLWCRGQRRAVAMQLGRTLSLLVLLALSTRTRAELFELDPCDATTDPVECISRHTGKVREPHVNPCTADTHPITPPVVPLSHFPPLHAPLPTRRVRSLCSPVRRLRVSVLRGTAWLLPRTGSTPHMSP
jgi:hypothetical protein